MPTYVYHEQSSCRPKLPNYRPEPPSCHPELPPCRPELVSGPQDAETSSARQAGQNASPLRHASTGFTAGGQGIP